MIMCPHPISTPSILIPELAQKSVQLIQKHLRSTTGQCQQLLPSSLLGTAGQTPAASALPCYCRHHGCEPGIVWVKDGRFLFQMSSFQCNFKRAKLLSQKFRFPVENLVLHEEVSTAPKSSLFNTQIYFLPKSHSLFFKDCKHTYMHTCINVHAYIQIVLCPNNFRSLF